MAKTKKTTKTEDVAVVEPPAQAPEPTPVPVPAPTPTPKKRASKPKSSTKPKPDIAKTTMETSPPTEASTAASPPTQAYPIANIILHLNCNLKDLATYNEDLNKQIADPLAYNPSIPPDILTYNQYEISKNYSSLDGGELSPPHEEDYAYRQSSVVGAATATAEEDGEPQEDGQIEEFTPGLVPPQAAPKNEMKEIYTKLKRLKITLFKNMAYMEKKSACFWCTYDFDNPECYIPKYEIDGTLHGYGSFCRPECAAAYLMKENIDDSAKFERYHLLNQIYSKVFDYTKNIKPAPSPYYMLDKFYGNMTIQEYRKLLKSQHLLFVIEKPLTRVLPELHEDNDEFLSNIYGTSTISAGATGPASTALLKSQQTGMYKVRRQSDKVGTANTKTNLMKEHFGVVSKTA